MVTTPPPGSSNRRFMLPFKGKTLAPPPVWLMRQAGRYLPEYRATRADAGGFLELCYTPELATEVTLQPIRRYGFDAAILFSDILVVPDALGQSVSFLEGEGPKLDPIRSEAELKRLDTAATKEKFSIVAETVQRIRQDLPAETALIGFCGAPWTVATYMVGGEGSSDQAEARLWAYRDPQGLPEADRYPGFGVDRLSLPAGARRRRRHPDFRQLGRQSGRGRVCDLGHRADSDYRLLIAAPAPWLADHRFPERSGTACHTLCGRDRGGCDRL